MVLRLGLRGGVGLATGLIVLVNGVIAGRGGSVGGGVLGHLFGDAAGGRLHVFFRGMNRHDDD